LPHWRTPSSATHGNSPSNSCNRGKACLFIRALSNTVFDIARLKPRHHTPLCGGSPGGLSSTSAGTAANAASSAAMWPAGQPLAPFGQQAGFAILFGCRGRRPAQGKNPGQGRSRLLRQQPTGRDKPLRRRERPRRSRPSGKTAAGDAMDGYPRLTVRYHVGLFQP
jgi:hypothetical protein